MEDLESGITGGTEGGIEQPQGTGKLFGTPKRDADGAFVWADAGLPRLQAANGKRRGRRKWTDEQRKAASERAKARFRATAENSEAVEVDETAQEVKGPVKPAEITKDSVQQLSALLFISNTLISGLLRAEDLRLSEKEAQALGEASAKVLRWYEWGGPSEKTMDHLALLATVTVIYGPKFKAMKARAMARKAAVEGGKLPDGVAEPRPQQEAAPKPDDQWQNSGL